MAKTMTFEVWFIENGTEQVTRFTGTFESEEAGKKYVLDFFGFNEGNPDLKLLSIKTI